MANLQEKTAVVELAGKTFVVKRIPMARVKRIETVLAETFTAAKQDIDFKAAAKDPQSAISLVMDKLLTFPHALLSLFIDDLPVEIFTDEENGVDLPDFLEALRVALVLNRVDKLGNLFSRLTMNLIETQRAQASISRKTS